MQKYNPHDFENKHYNNWVECSYFASEDNSKKEPFSIILPPPNVTGVLHMGHALTVTIEDIIVRFKRMQGYNVTWVPGTDHAGIATQMVVERELLKEGVSRHQLGREKFLEKVWQTSNKHHDIIINQLKKLGVSLDWDRERFSLDENFNKAVNAVFIELYNKGLVYRSEKLISWCTRCGTALSDLEVSSSLSKSKLYYIKYYLKDSKTEFVVVATTRPETLLGDTAVAVNPNDLRYKNFHNKKVIIPFVNREVPVILDDYVDTSFGTGCLKITPSHDFNDYEIAKKLNLNFVTVINKEGLITEVGLSYKGLTVQEARNKIIKDLEDGNLLVKIEDYENNLSKCSRCDELIEPLLSKQWFIKMDSMAKKAIDAVKNANIKFYPENWWEQTYYNWLENIRDWCVSRQLWWGHRIPVWYCKTCSQVFITDKNPGYCKCGSYEIEQETDVLDTWFSAALWPFVAFGWPVKTKALNTFYPNSLMETGFDIIFFWVARMIMLGLEFMDDVPFKHVLFHAMIRDEKGQKMSKTRGNVIDPLEIINKYGADALRISLASYAGNARDIKLSNSLIENYYFFMNKIWQASNYVFINTNDVEIKEKEDFSSINNFANKAILMSLNNLIINVNEYFNVYALDKICDLIYKFFKNDFCDKYIECSKILLKDATYVSETKEVLAFVHYKSLLIMHPFIPFITEELFLNSKYKKESIMIEKFPEIISSIAYNKELIFFNLMFEIISNIRNIKNLYNINSKIRVYIKSDVYDLNDIRIFLKDILFLEDLIINETNISDGVKILIPGIDIIIPAKDYIDYELEKNRISKKLEKIKKDYDIYNNKLNNSSFLNNASIETIEKDKIKHNDLLVLKTELENALKNLEY